MKFIEMTGKMLTEIVSNEEMQPADLKAAEVFDDTVVRINQQGDIEVRRPLRWDLVGGLLGNFEDRIKRVTGMDWA